MNVSLNIYLTPKKIAKVVTTMITKRPCIPVALINSLSGMTDRLSHALRYSLW